YAGATSAKEVNSDPQAMHDEEDILQISSCALLTLRPCNGLGGQLFWLEVLPEVRHETVSDLLCVFHIPWQILLQQLLLVQDSPNQRRRCHRDNGESPPRVECEGYAGNHDEDAHVHWMPHERVGASGDDFLVRNRLNGRSPVTVFLEHEQNNEES